jgi:hypothetical protein
MTEKAFKYDQGKQRFDMLPFDLMDGEQRVWEAGAKKYPQNNWREAMSVNRAMNACMRHLTAFMLKEDTDPETKESHLDHAICCIRMMQNTLKYFPEKDDRVVWEAPKQLELVPKEPAPMPKVVPQQTLNDYLKKYQEASPWR